MMVIVGRSGDDGDCRAVVDGDDDGGELASEALTEVRERERTVKERFPRASDADIDALLPPKVEIKVSKYQNRVLVYGIEGGFPMFFDIDGRGKEIFPTVAPIDVRNKIAEEVTAKVGDLKLTDDDSADQSTGEDQHPLSAEDVDMLLEKCLLQALHTTVKDKDLPMPGSTLWSNYVLPCRPSGITLDIKKSSYKKLSKWLQAKCSTALIRVKEDKYKKESVLLSVNRSHPDYSSFKPEKRQVEEAVQTGVPAVSESRSVKILEVAEIYKPSVHVNPVFTSVGADTGELYSALDATDIVFKYVEMENLVKPTDKSIVILDAILYDALFKGAIKKGSTYPTEIHKRDLGAAFVNRMQAHHIVTRGNDSVVRKGKKGQEVLVQGGVIENLAKHLIEQYGIPKRYIEVLDKTRR